MYSFFIGIDVSKDYIDVSYILLNKAIYLGRFENSETGFLSFLQSLNQKTNQKFDSWFFCFENTGAYSKSLANWLYENDISYREESPLQISNSLGLKRGKNDKADSRDIARYCFEKRDLIKASKPAKPPIFKLKKLLARRNLLVKQRTSFSLSFTMQKTLLEGELYDLFEKQTKELIAILNSQIKELDKEIEHAKKADLKIQKNDDLIRSVIGVGPIVSGYILAYTENFERLRNPKKLASYVGVAPFENRSGKYKGKTKVSHMANKKLKSLLSNAALSAINHDPQLANYYQRKLKEGKAKGSVINAVKNKLIHRIYAVVKRQSPFVKLTYV